MHDYYYLYGKGKRCKKRRIKKAPFPSFTYHQSKANFSVAYVKLGYNGGQL